MLGYGTYDGALPENLINRVGTIMHESLYHGSIFENLFLAGAKPNKFGQLSPGNDRSLAVGIKNYDDNYNHLYPIELTGYKKASSILTLQEANGVLLRKKQAIESNLCLKSVGLPKEKLQEFRMTKVLNYGKIFYDGL